MNLYSLYPSTLWAIFRMFVCFLVLLPAMASALTGGDFELVDHNGNPYRLEQDRGKMVLMFFGYTSCPDVCPQTMSHIKSVLKQLDAPADQLQNLFITVDPARDTVRRLSEYVPWFSDRVMGLTGSTVQIKRVASQYNARYKLHNTSSHKAHYTVDHSADLYLIDRAGELAAVIPFGLPVEHTVKVIRNNMIMKESELSAAQVTNADNDLPLLLESPVQLKTYKGRPLLLNFWASWCGPCREEIPSLNESYKLHADLPLNMVAVNVGESKQAVTKFLQDYPINFDVALDESGDSFQRWQLKGLPLTLLFDAQGVEVMRVTGERDWSSGAMVSEVRAALSADVVISQD